MSKTIKQLTETTTAVGGDLLHIVDVSASQDLKMKNGTQKYIVKDKKNNIGVYVRFKNLSLS